MIVFAKHLNPTADDIDEIMPGNLEGKNMDGENVALETYGMLAVELETPSGQLLNLGNDKKAQLTFPVPAGLQGIAPAEIPLWYFDEQEGLWVEEESATFDGSNYVGEVGHFSFWNCDAPFPLIEISGCFIDEDGFPITNKKVKITNLSTGNCGFGTTNEEGCFRGKVPKDEQLKLELLSECMVPFYSGIIVTQSADLGTIQATEYVDQFFTSILKGRAVNCDGVVLDEVVLEVDAGGEISYYVVDGAGFEISVEHCVNLTSLSMRARVIENQNSIVSLPIEVSTSDVTQIVGDLAICANDDLFMKVTLEGESFTYYFTPSLIGSASFRAPPATSNFSFLISSFSPQDSTGCIHSASFENWLIGDSFVVNNTTGKFRFNFTNLNGAFSFQENLTLEYDEANKPDVEITINRMDGVGGYVKGTYEFKGIYTEGRYIGNGTGPVPGADEFPVDVLVEFSLPRTR